jgi:hypothetical protein
MPGLDPKIYSCYVPHRWLPLEGVEVLRLGSLAFAEDHERLAGPSRGYLPLERTCASPAVLAARHASLGSSPSVRRSVNWSSSGTASAEASRCGQFGSGQVRALDPRRQHKLVCTRLPAMLLVEQAGADA